MCRSQESGEQIGVNCSRLLDLRRRKSGSLWLCVLFWECGISVCLMRNGESGMVYTGGVGRIDIVEQTCEGICMRGD